MINIRRQERYKAPFIVVLIAVLLSSCIFIGTMLAWLTQDIARESNDLLNFGEVDFELYLGETKLDTSISNADGTTKVQTSEMEIVGNSTIREINLTVRNTGNIDSIIRTTLSIYTKDEKNNSVALVIQENLTLENGVSIQNDGWVNDFKDDVSSGYAYYNSVINPYVIKRVIHNDDGTNTVTSQEVSANAVPILSQILVPDSRKNDTYYIKVTVEGVAYKGNIYQELADKNSGYSYSIPVEAYPFGIMESLPAGWVAWK